MSAVADIAEPAGARLPTASLRWTRRLLPVATSAALLGAAGYVAANDPSAAGSRYPGCLFHTATGLWCPGCGLTRGVHALLNGHPLDALGHNLFTPAVVLAVSLAMLGWIATAWGRQPLRMPARPTRLLATAVPVVLLVYGAARNIPVTPFRALAP